MKHVLLTAIAALTLAAPATAAAPPAKQVAALKAQIARLKSNLAVANSQIAVVKGQLTAAQQQASLALDALNTLKAHPPAPLDTLRTMDVPTLFASILDPLVIYLGANYPAAGSYSVSRYSDGMVSFRFLCYRCG